MMFLYKLDMNELTVGCFYITWLVCDNCSDICVVQVDVMR